MDALFLPEHKELLRLVVLEVRFEDFGAFMLTCSAVKTCLWKDEISKIRQGFRKWETVIVGDRKKEYYVLPGGKKDGIERKLNQDHLIKETQFINGYKEGKRKLYFIDGMLRGKEYYRRGVKDGLYMRWYDNGQLHKKCYYRNGDVFGLMVEYYNDGSLLEEGSYFNGNCQGLYRACHPDGATAEEGCYHNDRKEGKWTYWYDNGHLSAKGKYHMGVSYGTWKCWNTKGERIGGVYYGPQKN